MTTAHKALDTYRKKRDFNKTSEPSGSEKKNKAGTTARSRTAVRSKNAAQSKNASRSKNDKLTFVIQKHAASHLHYDFRIEAGGTLVSWAVPKGPSLNPADKRLAMHVEDHPLSYASFEGHIPEGQYGGGDVIVWDNGTYKLEGAEFDGLSKDAAGKAVLKAIAKGKLTIELSGKKLKGAYSLVQLKKQGSEKAWLLIKSNDEYANDKEDVTEKIESVLSKRRLADPLEAIKPKVSAKTKVATKPKIAPKTKVATKSKSAPKNKAVIKTEKAAKAKTKNGGAEAKRAKKPSAPKETDERAVKKLPKIIEPMLASLATGAFSADNWIYEPKYDGIRAIAYIYEHQAKLLSRNGIDITEKFPLIVSELEKFDSNMILDGEICALTDKGVPNFELLQARSLFMRQSKSKDGPLTKYFLFDIMQANSDSLLAEPLSERLKVLQKHAVRKANKYIVVTAPYSGSGEAAYAKAIKDGMEGIVAKALNSSYVPGKRTPNWLKVKGSKSSEFVICGYTKGSGARDGYLGALIIADRKKDSTLQYAGKVGTGFNTALLEKLTKQLNGRKVAKAPIDVPAEYRYAARDVVWVKPELVAEIKYSEKTKQGLLRAPVYMHLRTDIGLASIIPEEVVVTTGKNAEVEAKATAKKKSPAKVKSGAGPEAVKEKDLAKTKSVAKSKSVTHAKRTEKSVLKADKKLAEIIDQLDAAGESSVVKIDQYPVKFSHLDKVLWPAVAAQKNRSKSDEITVSGQDAVTKRNYVRYLLQVSPYLLPHLKDRPFTLIRMPDGIGGQKFFQKHQPAKSAPPFLETVDYYSEHSEQDGEFLLCNNLATLAWCGQMAGLELHASHTRITADGSKRLSTKTTGSLKNVENSVANYPDYLVLDLDPYIYSGKEKGKEEPQLHKKGFDKTCEAALWLKEILDELGLNAFVKTSGRTGLHIYVPIERNLPYDAVRSCCETIGQHLLAAHPEDITMEWSIKKRPGKIFFDHNMNGRGKTLPAPYSLRGSVNATVSTPLDWSELGKIYPTDFTLYTVLERLQKKGDIWANILDSRNDLKKKLNLK